ncbi:hypothetical protein ACOMHN_055142 [Nucella lapillus]
MSHLFIESYLSQGQGVSEPVRRGPGRPRGSSSRARPFGGRRSVHKLVAGKKTDTSVSVQQGTGLRLRGRGTAFRGRGRGGQKRETSSQVESVAIPGGGIAAALLRGAMGGQNVRSRGRRGRRGMPAAAYQRGRGFHSLKNMFVKKYGHKYAQPEAHHQGGRGGSRGRRGGPRQKPGSPLSAVHGMAGDSEAATPAVAGIPFQPGFYETYPEAVKSTFLALAERGRGRGRSPQRRGVVRRGVGRPRKIPGPLSQGSPTLRIPSAAQSGITSTQPSVIKEETTGSEAFSALQRDALQAQTEHIRAVGRRPYKRRGGAQPGASRPLTLSVHDVLMQAASSTAHDVSAMEVRESGLDTTSPLLPFEERSLTEPVAVPGPSTAVAPQEQGRSRGRGVAGRRRGRGRVYMSAGHMRGNLHAVADSGIGKMRMPGRGRRGRGRTISMTARGVRGRRVAGFMTPRRGGLLSVRGRGQAGIMAALTHIRGRGGRMVSGRGRRRGGYRGARGRGLRGRGMYRPLAVADEADDPQHVKTDADSTGQRWECSACGKSYAFQTGLGRHKKQCVAYLSHQCLLCDRVFYGVDEFSLHAQDEHGIEESDIMMLSKKL